MNDSTKAQRDGVAAGLCLAALLHVFSLFGVCCGSKCWTVLSLSLACELLLTHTCTQTHTHTHTHTQDTAYLHIHAAIFAAAAIGVAVHLREHDLAISSTTYLDYYIGFAVACCGGAATFLSLVFSMMMQSNAGSRGSYTMV